MGKESTLLSRRDLFKNGLRTPPRQDTTFNILEPYKSREENAAGSVGALLGGIAGGIAAEVIYLRYKDFKVPRSAVLRELRFFAEAIGLFGTCVVGGGLSGQEIGRTIYKLAKDTEGNK